MNKKILIPIILIILLIGVGIFSWQYFNVPKEEINILEEKKEKPGPYLTQSMVLSLLDRECLAEGDPYSYTSCIVNILEEEKEKQWLITIIYDGLKDDSVRASKITSIITYQEGQWVVDETTQTQKCWPGRGHQYFSSELCI